MVNWIKAMLARLGIRAAPLKLLGSAARLDELRTGEGEPVPPLTRAELRREVERLALVREQIKQIDTARREQLAQVPACQRRIVGALSQIFGLGNATADMLATRCSLASCGIARRWRGTPG